MINNKYSINLYQCFKLHFTKKLHTVGHPSGLCEILQPIVTHETQTFPSSNLALMKTTCIMTMTATTSSHSNREAQCLCIRADVKCSLILLQHDFESIVRFIFDARCRISPNQTLSCVLFCFFDKGGCFNERVISAEPFHSVPFGPTPRRPKDAGCSWNRPIR